MTAADEERRRFAAEMRANGWMPSPTRRPLSTQEREAAMAGSRDRHAEAIDVVARGVIADIVDVRIGDVRESYPEIGEYDWHAVVMRAIALTDEPRSDQWSAAYGYLSQRAGGETP